MTQPETIPVPRNVVEGVILYLRKHPYEQVAEGIAHLSHAVQQADEQAKRLNQPLDPATERAVNGVLSKVTDSGDN